MGKFTKYVTINLQDGMDFEETIIGDDGSISTRRTSDYGKNGHYKNNGEYRKAIERFRQRALNRTRSTNKSPQAKDKVKQNKQKSKKSPVLQYDSFGLLPADGLGRLSKEDY